MLAHPLGLTADNAAALVEAVLAGAPTATVAADAGIDAVDLDVAVQTYRIAGTAALLKVHDDQWFHAYVEPSDWETAEEVLARELAPRLEHLDGGRARWWFLRKHPHWRLRVHISNHRTVEATLDLLVAMRHIAGWRPGVYEPEQAAFGGPTGMAIAHDLFCADSRGLLAHSRVDPAPNGRHQLSLLLIRTLQHHAGLDWYEIGDVFAKVAQMRPAPGAADHPIIGRLAVQLRPLLALPDQARTGLFTAPGPHANAESWHDAYAVAGRRLATAAAGLRLERGLRATIAQLVIFHWNRIGLSAHAQTVLAHAATTTILPRS
ncbi:thiopeptide-type bacteriocin biosynthesis protein [Hamadaea sp. NPDC051192]|uniref:thiopeptide-type bacteriocin biosynthesis protein n=1 Tax=Hamadaea sp. NPDC051192 TaxID=3154940 RepID=UPI00342D308C